MPALDVLKLDRNEGANYGRDINLLFAASGDIRNAIKSITGMSPMSLSQQQTITAVVNDRNFDVVARNAILLLAALYVKPAPAAAAAMLHIWYSALIPSSILQTLRTTVLPLIKDVCVRVADKPEDKLLAKAFTQGPCKLRLVLEKRHWVALLGYLDVPDGLTKEGAERVRRDTVLAETRKDYRHQQLLFQIPGWRGPTMRFCREGVLMPFGASKQMFDTPNPTFFQEKDVWPMMDHADPIAGWSLEDILQSTPLAKHDIYGGLFFHLREVLIDFCTKLQTMNVKFVLLHTDAANLPDTLGKDLHMMDSFDRIDVSNITDQYYLGLKCLYIFAPLLRPLNENPCATLVTLFMNAIGEVETQADAMACTVRELPRLLAYLPPERQPQRSDTDTVRLTSAYYMYHDFDSLFERYKKFLRFDDIAKDAGLRAKSKHTIVKPWPLRLRKNATKTEFEKLFGSPHKGNEHYVEWKRLA